MQQHTHGLAGLYAGHFHTWAERFAEACAARRVDGVVVFSGRAQHRFRDDIAHPFFAEPYFKAWVPLTAPDAALRIVPGETPLLVHVQRADYWHAPPEAPEGFWTQHFEIRPVADTTALLEALGTRLGGLAALGEAADASMGFATVNDPALLGHLDYYRACKTAYEIACMAAANRIAAAGHAAAGPRWPTPRTDTRNSRSIRRTAPRRVSASPSFPTRTSSRSTSTPARCTTSIWTASRPRRFAPSCSTPARSATATPRT